MRMRFLASTDAVQDPVGSPGAIRTPGLALKPGFQSPFCGPNARPIGRLTGTMLSKTDPAKTYLGQE